LAVLHVVEPHDSRRELRCTSSYRSTGRGSLKALSCLGVAASCSVLASVTTVVAYDTCGQPQPRPKPVRVVSDSMTCSSASQQVRLGQVEVSVTVHTIRPRETQWNECGSFFKYLSSSLMIPSYCRFLERGTQPQIRVLWLVA
jgi:hypothetical protein